MSAFLRTVRFGLLTAAIAAVWALIPTASASAAGPNAVRNLAGCGTNTLAHNDDDSTLAVNIGFNANFFGTTYSQLYVNNNGNVTFDNPLGDYTPFDFTTTGDVMIAPFLADVDTTNAPGDGSKEVTYGTDTLGGHNVFCVNWVDVGYFAGHVDKTNSFQLLLIDQGSGNFNIEFNYDRATWETGDASDGTNGFGGTPAAVGWSSGDGDPSHAFVRDGSFQSGALIDGGPKALISGTLNAGGQLGRYVFNVGNPSPTGSTLSGEVDAPASAGGDPISRAPVEICSGGTCISRFTNAVGIYTAANLPAGNYTITAHSGGPASNDSTEYADGVAGPKSVSGAPGVGFTQDVQLGEPLGGPPAGTTIGSVGSSSGGVPTLYWEDPSPLSTDIPGGCTPSSVAYTVTIGGSVVESGPMTESPSGSRHYTVTIPAFYPAHGNALVHIAITGPGCSAVDFAIYIDPSGVVRNAGTGAVIPGATVTLFRSANASGPFVQVPDQSATMSPGNRDNPDQTDGSGHFGWDVIAGYYKVEASAPGCATASTGVLNIPPPVTNLDIRLSCPTGGGQPQQPLSTAPASKKCKKKKKGRSAVAAKKCKKKKGRSAAASASRAFGAQGLLFVGVSETK